MYFLFLAFTALACFTWTQAQFLQSSRPVNFIFNDTRLRDVHLFESTMRNPDYLVSKDIKLPPIRVLDSKDPRYNVTRVPIFFDTPNSLWYADEYFLLAWFLGTQYISTKQSYPQFVSIQGRVKFAKQALGIPIFPNDDIIFMVSGTNGVLRKFIYQKVLFEIAQTDDRRIFYHSDFGEWYPEYFIQVELNAACKQAHGQNGFQC